MDTRLTRITYAALLALGLAAPFIGLYPVMVMKLLCFALFACAFNLLLGFTGLLSFGHAAFFGFSAYVTGWFIKSQGWTPELALLAGMAVAAFLGLAVGLLAIRRQGIYFAMITLALAQMVFFICLQAPFTGGEDGLQGVPRGALLGLLPLQDDLTLYYVVLAIFVFGYCAIYRIIHSPFGQVLKAIRDNEQRAQSLGYEADRQPQEGCHDHAGQQGQLGRPALALDEPAGHVGGETEEGRMAEGQEAGEPQQQVEGAGEQGEAQELHHEHRVQTDEGRGQAQGQQGGVGAAGEQAVDAAPCRRRTREGGGGGHLRPPCRRGRPGAAPARWP